MYRNHPVIEQNIQMYDDYYEKPDWWFRFRYDTQVKRKTCLHLLQHVGRSLKHQRVLEIGFGSGAVLFSFDRSCEIYGMEISHSAIAHAEKKATGLGYRAFQFELVNGDRLSYEDGYFDLIIASHVIEHVEDDGKLLQEIRRTLRKEGVAIILVPINEKYDDPNHLHRYTTRSFLDLAERHLLVPIYQVENELLFHFVERFYFEEYSKRWKDWGPIIAALFNLPTSVLPFWSYRLIDQMMMALGWKPRQVGIVLKKEENPVKVGP